MWGCIWFRFTTHWYERVSLTRLNILNFSSDAEASAKYAPKSSRRWKGGKALHIRCTLHFLKELFLASHICYNLLQRVIWAFNQPSHNGPVHVPKQKQQLIRNIKTCLLFGYTCSIFIMKSITKCFIAAFGLTKYIDININSRTIAGLVMHMLPCLRNWFGKTSLVKM